MNKYLKSVLIAFTALLIIFLGVFIYRYNLESNNVTNANICNDHELIVKLIDNNINPFSKFKFLKKRNADCKFLLASGKEEALEIQDKSACEIIDASSNSVLMLIDTYIKDLYDRETASKELKEVVILLQPYSYCGQFYPTMLNLVDVKKRMGL